MKYKATIRECRNLYNCIKVGYCGLQNLLHYESPTAYTCGVYGWNFDVYELDNLSITTGYRGMVGRSVDYELIRKYDKKAESIIYDYSHGWTYEQKKKKVRKLLADFATKC